MGARYNACVSAAWKGVSPGARDNAFIVGVAVLIAAAIIGGKLLRWF